MIDRPSPYRWSRSRNILVTAIVAALDPSSFAAAGAEDWPRWRGPDLTGISRETDWRSVWDDGEPPVIWRAEAGTGFSSVSVADGRLVTMGHADGQDRILCLSADDGSEFWVHRYEAPIDAKFFEGGPTATPTIDGDRVFTLARRGTILCLELATGKVVWSRDLAQEEGIPVPSWGFAGSVLAQGDRLLINVGSSGMALDKASGNTLWKSETGESGYATPLPATFGDRNLVLFAGGREFSAVDPASGERVWTHRWLTRYGVNAADPIVDGRGHVFISSGYGKGCALLRIDPAAPAAGPEVVWTSKVMRNQMNPCVLLDGKLYGSDGDEGDRPLFKCIDFLTGREHWAEPGIGACGVTAAADRLIILSERGELVLAPARSDGLEPTLRMQVLGGRCWTAPVLSGGRIYCRNAAGDLACVDLRTEAGAATRAP